MIPLCVRRCRLPPPPTTWPMSPQRSATRFPVMLQLSGQKVGRVTVTKQDIPGEPTELNPLRPS